MRAPAFLVAAVTACGLSSAADAATCEVFRQPLAFATDARIEMIVRSGRDCRVRFPSDEITFVIERNELTGRPLHGGARVQGAATAYYRSNPGYKGYDYFMFQVCGRHDERPGCSNILVKVLVR